MESSKKSGGMLLWLGNHFLRVNHKKLGNFIMSSFVFCTVIIFVFLAIDRFYFSRSYDLTIDDINIYVLSDECETCFMDWPITHSISVWNKKKRVKKDYSFYTEGPRLQFGINEEKTKLLVSCPGFSFIIIELKTMKELEFRNGFDFYELKSYTVLWEVGFDKALKKLKTPELPDKNWKE